MAVWVIDQAHSNATFAVRHLMMTTVRGQFRGVTGQIVFDPENIAASSVEAAIDATTIDTGVADRDNHLRSADFLDTAHHPTITFKSTNVEPVGSDRARITGDLTIRGVTRQVVIDAEFLGVVKGAFDGKPHAGFSGTTQINREDFGLTWNVALEAGGVLVGKEVKITLDIQGIQVEEGIPAQVV